MNDHQIVDLFWNRDENAIAELQKKYGSFCFKIAFNILSNNEDSEECVNDTLYSVWSYIPDKRPAYLSGFTGRITRGHALDCLRKKYAAKRADLHTVSIEETTEIDSLIAENCFNDEAESMLTEIINKFLKRLSPEDRDIFLRRYWYMDSEKEIAKRHGKSENAIKMNLYRSRNKLRQKIMSKLAQ